MRGGVGDGPVLRCAAVVEGVNLEVVDFERAIGGAEDEVAAIVVEGEAIGGNFVEGEGEIFFGQGEEGEEGGGVGEVGHKTHLGIFGVPEGGTEADVDLTGGKQWCGGNAADAVIHCRAK